jgi:hypothetical protein
MCEAAGMVPQLETVAGPFGITVKSSGGFESTTEKYHIARELSADDRETEVLHIGDHDPSGLHMFFALAEDVAAFAAALGGPSVTFTRIAVTPSQITRYRLPTAIAKPEDRRAFEGDTCQAEALPPDVMANILRKSIEARLDRAAYDAVLAEEEEIRAELRRRLEAAE